MRRVAGWCGAAIVALALLVYFRPIAVFSFVRSVYFYTRGIRGHDVQLGAHRIHYRTLGERGPAIVLVHGLGSSGADWGTLMPDLARAHRVYALDLLGYGRSDKPRDGDYSIAAQTELVRSFMDALHIGRADVIGVSMGGWIAMRLAATHRDRVTRLVLFDSAGFRFETTLVETTFTPATMAELRKDLALQTKRASQLPDFVGRDILREIREDAPILRASMRSMLSGRDLMDAHTSTITMPTLLIWGADDRITPLAVGQRMQRELPNAKLIVEPGCGHLAVVECRDAYMPQLLRFLDLST